MNRLQSNLRDGGAKSMMGGNEMTTKKKPVFTGLYGAFRKALENGSIQPWQRDPWPTEGLPKAEPWDGYNPEQYIEEDNAQA